MPKKNEKASLRETLLLHMRCYRDVNRYCPGRILSFVLHDIVYALHPLATIFLTAQIIDELAGLRRPDVLWFWVAVTVTVEAILGIANVCLHRWERARKDLSHHKKESMFVDKMMSMDYSDADRQETHDKRRQIRQNEEWATWGMGMGMMVLDECFAALIEILGAAVLTVSLFTTPVPETAGALTILNQPVFLAAMLGAMCIVIITASRTANKATASWAKAASEARFGKRLSRTFHQLQREPRLAMDFRIYDQQNIASHYLEASSKFFGVGSDYDRLRSGSAGFLAAVSSGATVVFTGIVYLFVCLKAWAGAFGIGSVTLYVGAITALCIRLTVLLRNIGSLRSNTPFVRTIYEFLDVPNDMYRGSLTTEKRTDRHYEIEFRNVSFRYPGSEVWALRNVSMKLTVGSRIAIVGENGSGKSTFIKLLCRLYDPQEGQILLNGIDIRKYNQKEYMDVFSVVFQDFQLLSQSLGANVAGSRSYDAQRVRQCLRDAGFNGRIGSLPDGLDTLLYKEFSPKGIDVTGEEALKIAIARALYKDAPFIILDEPTAALDPVAEADIYSKFSSIAGDKTALYISHRLSSCKFCDEIAVFHQGNVVQRGTHEELVADKSGKYYELWRAQAKYYVDKAE